MDKNLKKIKYQELFLSELRTDFFAEKKIEESLRQLETKENMKKLANALKNIWKKTDENVKDLEAAFTKSDSEEIDIKDPVASVQENPVIPEKLIEKKSVNIIPEVFRPKEALLEPSKLESYRVLTYDNLIALVNNLNSEQITQILESASTSDVKNHHYLTKVAEKLANERDFRA
jgi:ferritin-like metal-binding protein YciE